MSHANPYSPAADPRAWLPRLIAWEITRRCPLKCRHCRASADNAARHDELTTDQCRTVLDNIATFARPIMILTGGEPMLRPDVYDLAAYARSLGLPVVMATCGMLLNDDTVGRILAAGIRRISLSLDGADAASHDAFREFPGAFEALRQGAAAACRGGLDFQINTTVSRHNVHQLPQILELAMAMGASLFNPFLLVPVGRGKELEALALSAGEYERTLHWLAEQSSRGGIAIRVTCAPHYQRILRQRAAGSLADAPDDSSRQSGHGCMGGKSFAFISSTGKVQICGFLDVECGDLPRENFDFLRIWLTSEVFRRVRDTDSYHGRCGICEFRYVCGGCRARAYAATGDYLAEEPLCTYRPGPGV